MTQIETHRCGRETESKTTLLIVLGESYVYVLRKLLRISRHTAYYYFSRIFEQSNIHGESGVHKHITDLTFGKPYNAGFTKQKTELVWPTAATLDFDLDSYDRLRKVRMRGQAEFPEYTRIEG